MSVRVRKWLEVVGSLTVIGRLQQHAHIPIRRVKRDGVDEISKLSPADTLSLSLSLRCPNIQQCLCSGLASSPVTPVSDMLLQ